MKKKTIEKILISFQNFLILDGQLDIDNDEINRNADIFSKQVVEDILQDRLKNIIDYPCG